ncbi:unnamed protein product [Xylocopa violacea]|uniref:Chitin-binding type-2 domain-containing protein n=1 Tax=Xylocopa violacea TaxID=135666 RepID=A0ABP1PCT0_XYLVO
MKELLLPIVAILAVACSASPETQANPTSCPKVDSVNETVHLAHETDCTKFYKCSHGKKYVMDCPLYESGHRLHFDPTLQVCVFPWQTNCTTLKSDCSSDGYMEPHPYNCALFYVCENGEKSLKQCDNERLFDSKSMSCVPKADATCGTYLHDCPTRKLLNPVVLPHECKCTEYYECVNGEAIERHCEAGKNFDVERRECVAAEYAKCYPNRPTGVKCPSKGVKYIADETDCGSYYECTDGDSQKLECNDGLSFDPITSMCTWPPNVECSRGRRTRSYARSSTEAIKRTTHPECPPVGSARLPHECSCSIYYTCDEGKRIREECPEGLIYDYIMERCDYPQTAVCSNSKFIRGFVSGRKMATASPWAAAECTADGTERIPHESDCKYYYQCSHGKKQLQMCYDGHYFNEIIESCDLPSNTDCEDRTVETTNSSPEIVCSCPVLDCEGIIRCPDQRNCSWYFQCENSIAVSKKCPDGLYYDPQNQICDYPGNVNCVPNQCPKGERNHHECQCDLYYECDENGKKVVQQCPPGMEFDYERKVCDVPEKVKCWPPKDDTPNGCQGKCPADSAGRLPHDDCDKYCECEGGKGKVVTCGRNKFYDHERGLCDFPENVKDLNCDPFPCDAHWSGTLLPNECYCDLYYECRNGTKIRERCEDGKNFDYEKQRCVPCTSAHCYARMEPEGIADCKETCLAANASVAIEHNDCHKYCECNECRLQVVRECGKRQFFNPSTRRCDWPEDIKGLSCEPFPCGPGADEQLPHECDCHLFYVCKDGKKYPDRCPDGYNFDYVSGKCVTSGGRCYKKPSKNMNEGVEDSVELRCQM